MQRKYLKYYKPGGFHAVRALRRMHATLRWHRTRTPASRAVYEKVHTGPRLWGVVRKKLLPRVRFRMAAKKFKYYGNIRAVKRRKFAEWSRREAWRTRVLRNNGY